ncbi:MAG: ChrR family anti-sigma-E factor [Rhodomicrobiaceae bacterium]
MSIRNHPHASTLLSYASGTLPGAIAGLVACHVSLCTKCFEQARRLEMVGGLLLEQVDAYGSAEPARMPAARENPFPPQKIRDLDPRQAAAMRAAADPLLPPPLARYLGMSADEIPWRPVVKGLQQYWIKLPKGAGYMRLLKAPPRFRLLEHTHRGMELTMVLKGSYSDSTGEYFRGDVADLCDDVQHTPRVSKQGECICIIASETLPRYTQLFARVMQPFLKI